MPAPVLADLALARRLETTEGRGNAAFVEAQAATDPNSGAIWKSIGGTLSMFAGVGSPLTQTFGLGGRRSAQTRTCSAAQPGLSAKHPDRLGNLAASWRWATRRPKKASANGAGSSSNASICAGTTSDTRAHVGCWRTVWTSASFS